MTELEELSWHDLWKLTGSPNTFTPLKATDFIICGKADMLNIPFKILFGIAQTEYFVLHGVGSKILLRYMNKDQWVLDCCNHYGCLILGHNNPQIKQTIQNFLLNKKPACSFINLESEKLCLKASEAASEELRTPYECLCTAGSGTQCVDVAITSLLLKARVKKPACKIVLIVFDGAYHGNCVLGGGMCCFIRHYPAPFSNVTNGCGVDVISVPFELEKLTNVIEEQQDLGNVVGGVLLELIQRPTGLKIRPIEKVQAINAFLKLKEVPLVVDEVYTSFWRFGGLLLSRVYGIQPEIISLAKSSGGGYTKIGLTLLRANWMSADTYRQYRTPASVPSGLCSTISFTTLDLLWEKKEVVERNGRQRMETLVQRIQQINKEFPGVLYRCRGAGYALSIIFNFPSESLYTLLTFCYFTKHHIKALNSTIMKLNTLEYLVLTSLKQLVEGLKIFETIEKKELVENRPEDDEKKYSSTIFELTPEMSEEDLDAIVECIRDICKSFYSTDILSLLESVWPDSRYAKPLVSFYIKLFKAAFSIFRIPKNHFRGLYNDLIFTTLPEGPPRQTVPLPVINKGGVKKLLGIDGTFENAVGVGVQYISNTTPSSNKCVLDCTCLWSGSVLGDNCPNITNATLDFMEKNKINYYVQYIPKAPMTILKEKLQESCVQYGLDFWHLTCSSSESVELTLRIGVFMWYLKQQEELVAKHNKGLNDWAWTSDPSNEPPVILCMENAYHGTTLALLSMCSVYGDLFRTSYGNVVFLPVGVTPEQIREVFDKYKNPITKLSQISCFLLEPFQSEAACSPLSSESIQVMQQLCREHKVALIADETRTCFYRTGPLLMSERIGFKPDCVAFGTGLGNGVAIISCVGWNKTTYPCAKGHPISVVILSMLNYSTWNNDGFGCNIAISFLKTVQEHKKMITSSAQMFEKAIKEVNLTQLSDHHNIVEDVEVFGLLLAIRFRADFCNALVEWMQNVKQETSKNANILIQGYFFHLHSILVQPTHLNKNAILLQPNYGITPYDTQRIISAIMELNRNHEPEVVLSWVR